MGNLGELSEDMNKEGERIGEALREREVHPLQAPQRLPPNLISPTLIAVSLRGSCHQRLLFLPPRHRHPS